VKVNEMDKTLPEKIRENFPNADVSSVEEERLAVTVPKEELIDILSFVKNLGFDHLVMVSCVDWIDEGQFELVYIVTSYVSYNGESSGKGRQHIIVKIRIDRSKATFRTIIPVYQNAEPYEREIHELYGVDFQGHPRLTPLLLEREYPVPPFRKDFDSRNYVKEFFDSIPEIEEEK